MLEWISKNSINQSLLVSLGLLPLCRLIFLGLQNQLSANPIEFITRSTGSWALIFLCLTLTITPLRKIFVWNNLIRFRRTLGLISFFYATLHFSTWICLDHQFDWASIVKDFYKRTFILFGLISFCCMSLLALSSNKFSIRILKTRWTQLHQLIYPTSLIILLHYWLHKSGKNDYRTVSIYVVIILLLLGFRAYGFLKRKLRS